MNEIRQVEKFLREFDMPPTRFGRMAVGDPRLVLDMRGGREIRTDMANRINGFMVGYRNAQQPDQIGHA